MQYTVTRNVVQVIGHIWMPSAVAAKEYDLSAYDLENAKDDNGTFTRDSVERWVMLNTGDFQSIEDWSADFGAGDYVKDWDTEESEYTFGDCMCPCDD